MALLGNSVDFQLFPVVQAGAKFLVASFLPNLVRAIAMSFPLVPSLRLWFPP